MPLDDAAPGRRRCPDAPAAPRPTGAGARRPAAPPSLRSRRSIAGNVLRTGTAITLMFAILAVGAGYWQVVEAQRLSTAADNPAVIAIARRALRGPITDRNDRWLARSERDANGEALREYRDDALSHVVGYASRQYGTTGLERAYNAELIGLSSDGARRAAQQVRHDAQRAARPPDDARPPAPARGRRRRWATTAARS